MKLIIFGPIFHRLFLKFQSVPGVLFNRSRAIRFRWPGDAEKKIEKKKEIYLFLSSRGERVETEETCGRASAARNPSSAAGGVCFVGRPADDAYNFALATSQRTDGGGGAEGRVRVPARNSVPFRRPSNPP